jgi:hypothetical protein
MKKKLFLASAVFLAFALILQNQNAESSLPHLTYQLPQAQKWKRFKDFDLDLAGPKQYYFSDTDNIDLNVVPIDDDMLTSLTQRGEKQFVEDIMRGKNAINQMFAVGDSKLIDYKLSTGSAGQKILSLRTEQQIVNETFYVIEKYFIYPKQAVNFQLRFNQSSDQALVKQATALFEQINPQALNRK